MPLAVRIGNLDAPVLRSPIVGAVVGYGAGRGQDPLFNFGPIIAIVPCENGA